MKYISGVCRKLAFGLFICLLAILPTLGAKALPEAEPAISPPGQAAPIQDGRVLFFPTLYKHMYNLSACIPDLPGESNNVSDAPIVCTGQTVTGWVHDLDKDDVYKIWVNLGERLVITMRGYGGDAELYLYPPGTQDVNVDFFVASSTGSTNDERIEFTATATGYWYIDIYEIEGATNYFVTATIN